MSTPTTPTTRTRRGSEARKDDALKHPALDQPWHRPGALAYARRRRRAALHPPVTVYPMPADVTKDEDVPIQMRDGVTLRLNLFRPAGDGRFPVIGSDPTDEPAQVAMQSFDAPMKCKDKVIAGGTATKAQGVAAKVLPDSVKAGMHRKMAEPGSAEE